MVPDYVIVGGGLSGLYRAYCLAKKFTNAKIHLYQDSNRLGGRIYTHTLKNGEKVDMGAGRIAVHHEKTMKLLKELKLDKELSDPSSSIPISLNPLEYFEHEKDALSFLCKIAKTALNKLPKKYLTSMSFTKLCKIFFSKKYKKVLEAIHVSGYDTEFQEGNGWVMCNVIQDLYAPSCKFAVLKHGMGSITDALIQSLKKNKKVKLFTNRCVYGWRKSEKGDTWCVNWKSLDETNSFSTTNCKNLHIATGLGAWKYWIRHQSIDNIPVNMHDYIQSIIGVSLCRVYATYDSTNWIDAIQKCVTNTPLRYIIPISKHTVMISYLDGEKADELAQLDDSQMKEWVIEGTKLAFPSFHAFIPDPTEIKRGYWRTGVHLWTPMRRKMPPSKIQCDDPTFSLSGEAFSQLHQGWIEGALELHTEK